MIPETLTPTPLIRPDERAPVIVTPIVPSGRWRTALVARRWIGWLLTEAWSRVQGHGDPAARGRRLRALLEGLGGIWIKVGQLLSLRIDLLDPVMCKELARLQDRANGFPGQDALAIVAADLGQAVDAVFSEFDPNPVAAASIGQVHRARLLNGDAVAVKVQRPFVRESLNRELAFVHIVTRLLERMRIAPFMRWASLQWELEAILAEELDYLNEASAMERMHVTLRQHGLYVPAIYQDLSTARVLVMEFVTGVLMSDYIATLHGDPDRVQAWLRENNIDQGRVNRRLVRSVFRQLLEDNLYHGDLHPGNIVLLRDSRVALLDFGSVGFTEREYLERFRFFMTAIANEEYARAADMALIMGAPMPDIALEPVRAEMIQELLRWGLRSGVSALPYPLKSVDAINMAINRVFFEHGLAFEWAFLRISRAFATMDATAMHLYPEVDYSKETRDYLRRAARRQVARSVSHPGAPRVPEEETLTRLGEFTQLAAGIEQRRLRIAQSTLTGAASLVVTVTRWMTPLAFVAAGAGLVALAAQYGPSWLRTGALFVSCGLVTHAPALDWQMWIAVCACGWILARTAADLRAGFLAASQREST